MSFRPRYSLLAFLLFTAAVAGGVKLWRGPHHVIDRSNPQMEDDYFYYRQWNGTKIMDGVRMRRYRWDDRIATTYLHYYRGGELLPTMITIHAMPHQGTLAGSFIPRIIEGLEPHEDSSLRAACVQEMESIQQQGEYPTIKVTP
jgi:hypothetical protein